MTTLETDRLTIRPFTLDDLEDLHREVFGDLEVCRHYCGNTRTREETRDWIIAQIVQGRYGSHFGRWAVVRKDGCVYLGLVGLVAYDNYHSRWSEEPDPRYNQVEVELSFAFGQRHWGNGYAGEACRAMIRYAFEELRLRRLVGGAALENERSVNLQRRLGYRVERNLHPQWPGYVTILENDRIGTEGAQMTAPK